MGIQLESPDTQSVQEVSRLLQSLKIRQASSLANQVKWVQVSTSLQNSRHSLDVFVSVIPTKLDWVHSPVENQSEIYILAQLTHTCSWLGLSFISNSQQTVGFNALWSIALRIDWPSQPNQTPNYPMRFATMHLHYKVFALVSTLWRGCQRWSWVGNLPSTKQPISWAVAVPTRARAAIKAKVFMIMR